MVRQSVFHVPKKNITFITLSQSVCNVHENIRFLKRKCVIFNLTSSYIVFYYPPFISMRFATFRFCNPCFCLFEGLRLHEKCLIEQRIPSNIISKKMKIRDGECNFMFVCLFTLSKFRLVYFGHWLAPQT